MRASFESADEKIRSAFPSSVWQRLVFISLNFHSYCLEMIALKYSSNYHKNWRLLFAVRWNLMQFLHFFFASISSIFSVYGMEISRNEEKQKHASEVNKRPSLVWFPFQVSWMGGSPSIQHNNANFLFFNFLLQKAADILLYSLGKLYSALYRNHSGLLLREM